MRQGLRFGRLIFLATVAIVVGSGCATMRCKAPDPYHRPCTEAFTETDDGWRLGMRRVRPAQIDPGKLPIVLCHGLGLNGTFWTITDNHLPEQLAARGYDVYICDIRGSGASTRTGGVGKINAALRQTPFLEVGEASGTSTTSFATTSPRSSATSARNRARTA